MAEATMRVNAVMILPAIFTYLAVSSAALADSTANTTTYYDEEDNFSLTYHDSWSQVPNNHDLMRLKIASEKGKGSQDCSVYLRSSRTPKIFLRAAANVKATEKGFRKTLPDARIIANGATYLSDQKAVYYIMDFTVRSNSMDIPLRTYTVHTTNRNNIYTIICRARKDKFDENMPNFKKILSGFIIDLD